ncbi:Fic family protein [Algibacillus agarilyticus]|uniref:Fic family protein n=1 Tax=Algibacillus agarilyticus TaxID=2234133 RepID=UPI000DD06A70|nr:Fic family protein [Algibacillus agarilyticus]
MYIWQSDLWPQFSFDESVISKKLNEVAQAKQRLLDYSTSLPQPIDKEAQMDALLQNAIRTSQIEGEKLDVGSVRSSVAKQLGLHTSGLKPSTKQTDSLVAMLVLATENLDNPLTVETLCEWQALLFPEPPLLGSLILGELRGNEPMQVISYRGRQQTVHFEAPPKSVLANELTRFIDWFNSTDNKVHPLLKAGIAHLWFLTLHPFDDGNGRLARAITDRALAQADKTSIRFYSLSATIEKYRNSYYDHLELTQNLKAASQISSNNELDITTWLIWFLDVLTETIEHGRFRIDRVLNKSKFWHKHSQTVLSERQIKVLNRLLNNFGEEFNDGINASKYQSLAKVSKATATRDLTELVTKDCLIKLDKGGRSTRYQVKLATQK